MKELKKLFVPTKIGPKGKEVADRFYLPSYQELIEKYQFDKEDLRVRELVNINHYSCRMQFAPAWLRDDEPNEANGIIQTKGAFMKDVHTFTTPKDKQSIYNEFNHQYYNRLRTNLDIETYLKLFEANKAYAINYDMKKQTRTIELGKHFDINKGKKSNRKMRWRVLNWESLPKTINIYGDGTAQTIELVSDEFVGKSQFFANVENIDPTNFWASSMIRRDFNGYGDKTHSFFHNAFAKEATILKAMNEKLTPKKKTLAISTDTKALKDCQTKTNDEMTK